MVSVTRLASATSCSRVHLSRGGDRGFEPTFLQQGVCKPSVPRGGDRVVRKYATGLGLDRGYSAPVMSISAAVLLRRWRKWHVLGSGFGSRAGPLHGILGLHSEISAGISE